MACPKGQDKNLNILRAKRAFKMKEKAFLNIFEGLSLKQIIKKDFGSWEFDFKLGRRFFFIHPLFISVFNEEYYINYYHTWIDKLLLLYNILGSTKYTPFCMFLVFVCSSLACTLLLVSCCVCYLCICTSFIKKSGITFFISIPLFDQI